MEQLQRIFIPLLEEQAGACMIVVVGTKLDLVKTKGREIGASEGLMFARTQHQKHLAKAMETNPNTFLKKINENELYYETSSKTGEGVSALFKYIEKTLLLQLKMSTAGSVTKERSVSKSGKPTEKTIKLDETNPSPSQQQSQCCKS